MEKEICVLELSIKYTAYYHISLENRKAEQEGEACEIVLATTTPSFTWYCLFGDLLKVAIHENCFVGFFF